MSIFRAYDIRGRVPAQLDAALATRIGRAVARYLGAREIILGRDARSHSPELARAFTRGANEAGTDVLDLGLVATPMLYYAVANAGAAGGVMVTASHNPAAYNGFKLCRAGAAPIGGETGLAEIEKLCDADADARANSNARARAKCGAHRVSRAPLAGYDAHVRSVGGAAPPLRVAIDCGNGMAGVALAGVLERLPLTVKRLYFEPDGRFPNHPADPLVRENLRDLRAAVRAFGAQLGVAFDGDADRAVFLDEHGEPVPSDLMTGLLARAQLAREPGGVVLHDVRSSWACAEAIAEAGGVARRCRVGHAYMKDAMRRERAIFGGEVSGHFYFRFPSGLVADDGVAAFVALLDLLAKSGRTLSELAAPLRRYFSSGELNCALANITDASRLLTELAAEHADADEVSRLDGLLVRYKDWWFNLRASNTEPLLRLNLEARTRERLTRERARLLARMKNLEARA